MLTRLWNCMRRHKKKLIFFTAFFGGGWVAYKWLQQKVQEVRNAQDKAYLEKMKRQHHFDSNQRTCNMTVLSMVPNLREALDKELSSKELTDKLQNNPPDKLSLWIELKIVSVARGITGVYGCCLLTLLLRVQLNLMGGYLFLDTVHGKREEESESGSGVQMPKAVQERYLSLVKHLLGEGIAELAKYVKQATEKEVGRISLKEQMSIDYIQSVVNAVRERVECGNTELCQGPSTLPLCQYVLPGEQVPDMEVKTDEEELFDKLVKETRDIMESSDFHLVLQESLERGFARLMDNVADHYRQKMDPEKPEISLHEVVLPFAKVLPVMDIVITRLLCDAPNTFIQELLLLEQLKNFAANIYEAFSQEDLPSAA
ncbi:peroxisomal biogenesis factor 3-like [Babylonia areolata]|uniref:peroxisomal biogenesis factor 3-like n=1 Tax=Babylonia areolata TaxID=304850 RepID=UPI003FCFDD7D